MGNFKEDIARVEAIVLDVDGVMTDGGIIPTPDGDFIRRYDAKDGYAIASAIREGLKVCIISGGRGRMLENRLQMLGVTRYYLNCMDKIATMQAFLSEYNIDLENVIYIWVTIFQTLSVCALLEFLSAHPMQPWRLSTHPAISPNSMVVMELSEILLSK